MIQRVKVAGPHKDWFRLPTRIMALPFCPGCQEPVAGRAILEVLEEMNLTGEAIAIGGVGCATTVPLLMNIDFLLTAHGRPPDAATAIKRIFKDRLVFTVQGDGDCMAIGAGSTISAAIRGEKITIIMLNNTNYGTTGGQMSPTTLIGQRTTTSPYGRDVEETGYPVHVPELLAVFPGVAYTARGAVNTPANFQRVKKYLKKAFQIQLDNLGMSFVEIITACPTNWRLSPLDSLKFIEERIIPEYPLGEFKGGKG